MTASGSLFTFLGVTTAESSINGIFPSWMRELGRPDVVLEGVDLALHDDPSAYRRVIEQIRDDPARLGAVVTSHKVDVFAAAASLFDVLDPHALAMGEISCVWKGRNGLEGYALDAITAGQSLDAILGPGYFGQTSGQVLCFGAGGSGASIAAHLASQTGSNRPTRFVLVNRSQPRLDHVRKAISLAEAEPLGIETVCNEDPATNDDLLGSMPAGSVVINATGMGKDRPGSPITDAALFPAGAIAWDVNYRGDLLFLRQARGQAPERRVRAEDGWDYFVRGWAVHITRVLGIELTPEVLRRLAAIASEQRPQQGRPQSPVR